MNLLLDTHAFIWFLDGDRNLSIKARKYIENPANVNFISIASLWEIAIKVSIDRMKLAGPYEKIIEQIYDNGFDIMPVKFEHTLLISKMDFHHRDPFDRLIISQALSENFTIISKDKCFDVYKVKRIW
jgi:PIN domain nuclease of toxin-antitoxin system